MERSVETAGRVGNLVSIPALRAAALPSRGDTSATRTTRDRAPAIAEPKVYVRTFADEGEHMGALLSKVSCIRVEDRLEGRWSAWFDGQDALISSAGM